MIDVNQFNLTNDLFPNLHQLELKELGIEEIRFENHTMNQLKELSLESLNGMLYESQIFRS